MVHAQGASRAMWDADLSGWGKVLTTGANCMHEREVCVWDGRNLGKPLQRVRIGKFIQLNANLLVYAHELYYSLYQILMQEGMMMI